jgi:adenylate cyclase
MAERANRRLAAIVAADVAGYSRLIGSDEEGTLSALRAHRRELIDPLIQDYGGRIANTAGDSVLIEFPSAVDAVRCSLAVQRGMVERNADIPQAKRILFRVGINVGDVVAEGDDLLGDGVNVAARLESLAEPGGICLSRAARDQVRDRIELELEDLGEIEVKNITRLVRVFRVSPDDDPRPDAEGGTASGVGPAGPSHPSIAVLPFTNMSGDPEQEYFTDGICEDVITALSRVRSLSVIARNSSFTYKGRAVDIADVARELGVRYVVEGSVRKAANRVRVTAQLIAAESNAHLWADRYDRDLQDIFDVQDEIAAAIVGSIRPGIVVAEIERSKGKNAADLGNWDRLMRAHWHIRRFTRQDLSDAIQILQELLAREPDNVIALSDQALALHFDVVFGWNANPADAIARMGVAARRAVAADDQDSDAHTVLAIHDLFEGRHEDAARRLQRAVDLDPTSSFARGYLGTRYAFAGESDLAIEHVQAAMRMSPRDHLMVIWYTASAWALLSAERFADAVDSARQAIDWNAEFPDAHALLAAASAHLHKMDEAHAALAQFVARMPGLSISDERLARPLRRESDRERFLSGLRAAGLPEG